MRLHKKKETDNKIAKLESIKADKDTVYLKAESKKRARQKK